MNLNRLTRSIAVLGLGLMTAAPVSAQNLFAPVAKVNESVVTEFEVQQRQRFLEVLNAPGATREGALTSLIDERLRNEAVTLGLPATILVDDEGCELAVLQGPAHWNTPDGHRVIETLLEV
jgi:hypothetical protein